MQVVSNIPMMISGLMRKFSEIENPETVSRAVAVGLMPEIKERIHKKGLNSNGGEIGTYDNTYLEYRKKFGRSGSNVVASLTRMLELSYSLQATDKGYTIGFTSPGSDIKVKYLEEKYGTIWALTEKESNDVKLVAEATALELLK